MTRTILSFQFEYRLGMYRDAERQLKSALRDQDVVDTYLYLCKVYRRLDQPLTATEVYKKVCLGPWITYLTSWKVYL